MDSATTAKENHVIKTDSTYGMGNVISMKNWKTQAGIYSIDKRSIDTGELNTKAGRSNGRVRTLIPKQQLKKHSLFMDRVKDLLQANLDDENYGITQLCNDVGISRAQLHRNLKAYTGKSTSLFIRTLRLKKAKDLLLHTDLNITQVAYEVGFQDPKYFSRLFSSQYELSPREFRKLTPA